MRSKKVVKSKESSNINSYDYTEESILLAEEELQKKEKENTELKKKLKEKKDKAEEAIILFETGNDPSMILDLLYEIAEMRNGPEKKETVF